MLRGPADRFDVVFFAPWVGPVLYPGAQAPPGGAETQMVLLARGLARRGRRICFITLDTDEGLAREVDGITVHVLPRLVLRSKTIPGLRFAGYAMLVFQALLACHTKVVVQRAASIETGLVALVTRACGRRFVYSSANVIDFDYGRLEPRRRNVWLFHLGVRSANVVVVQTEEQATLCRRTFDRDPWVIRSVAELGAPRNDPEAFLWIGRLAPYKRPEDFLRLAKAIPEARFWLLGVPGGEGLDEEDLRETAARLPNVEWLLPRSRAEVQQLMTAAVAIVNTAEYEGMPNIFLEAWACGVPALSLRHDPDGVIVRERLGAFAEGDFDTFVANTRSLWERRSEEQWAIGERCRAYISAHHDPDVVLDAWERALELA